MQMPKMADAQARHLEDEDRIAIGALPSPKGPRVSVVTLRTSISPRSS
jgi:hypothetical protein